MRSCGIEFRVPRQGVGSMGRCNTGASVDQFSELRLLSKTARINVDDMIAAAIQTNDKSRSNFGSRR